MNKIVSVKSVVNLSTTPNKSRIETERIQDVLTLLNSLTAREEATIKLIIDCLYDIGNVNLIDRKVRIRSLNSIAKVIAKLSKPVVRAIAWRWFKKKCPQLIAQWLYRKVKF